MFLLQLHFYFQGFPAGKLGLYLHQVLVQPGQFFRHAFPAGGKLRPRSLQGGILHKGRHLLKQLALPLLQSGALLARK